MKTRDTKLEVMLWLLERQVRGEAGRLDARRKFYLFELEGEEGLSPLERAWMARLVGMMRDGPWMRGEMRRVLRMMRRGLRGYFRT